MSIKQHPAGHYTNSVDLSWSDLIFLSTLTEKYMNDLKNRNIEPDKVTVDLFNNLNTKFNKLNKFLNKKDRVIIKE